MIELRTHWGGLGNRLFQLAYIYAQARRGVTPDIYLQNEEYFAPYGEEIRHIFKQGVEPIDMVSLHVRRGDYLGNPFYIDLTNTDYYDRAMEQFPDSKFLVFCADRQPGSDDKSDMEWCKERFQGKQFSFYQGKSELEDFNAMAGCKSHIGANSSFSWWTAYTSGNKAVFPKEWFTDGKERISIPTNFTLI